VLVKVEILEDQSFGFKRATHFPEGDVEYKTLHVTPDGETLGQAPDEEWETPERMLHLANNYKRRVGQYKRLLQNNETVRLQNTMGLLYKDMMNGAAAKELEQQQLQRGVGGR
jgi:hypothetical protein